MDSMDVQIIIALSVATLAAILLMLLIALVFSGSKVMRKILREELSDEEEVHASNGTPRE